MKIKNFELNYSGEKISGELPFSVHSLLTTNNLIEDFQYFENEKFVQWIENEPWEIEFTFNLEKLESKKLILNKVDTEAEVFLNGKLICNCNNYFKQYTVLVEKENLQLENNKLVVKFAPYVKRGKEFNQRYGFNIPMSTEDHIFGNLNQNKVSPFIRKPQYQFGWDWAPRIIGCGIHDAIQIVSVEPKVKSSIDYTLDLETRTVTYNVKSDIEVAEVKINDSIAENNVIDDVQLWYPSGHGEAYLYKFDITFIDGTTLTKHIGFRQFEIKRENDEFGKSFDVYVNGIKVFIKGASHIPNEMSLDKLTNEIVKQELDAVKDANFNLIRVWGGGDYESDYFYDICDQYGILVWQDFMFACAMYPDFEEFLTEVEEEVMQVIERLKDRTSLLLFCGNNEISAGWSQGNMDMGWGWKKRYNSEQIKRLYCTYDDIFNKRIPALVKSNSDVFYWNSTPWTGDDYIFCDTKNNIGDSHFWGVWHEDLPISEFENHISRFVSEYGVQSFSSYELMSEFISSENMSLYSDEMIMHQKSTDGNKKIAKYINDLFGNVDCNFEYFCYLSQVSQAEALYTAISYHRKLSYLCGGTIYWQLNDVWPCASWSTIEYNGKYKAAHYAVKESYQSEYISVFKKKAHTELFYMNDREITATRKVKVFINKLNGEVLHELNYDVQLKPGKNTFITKYNPELYPEGTYLKIESYDEMGYIVTEAINSMHNVNLSSLNEATYTIEQVNEHKYKVKSDVFSYYTEFVTKTNLERNFIHMEPEKWYEIEANEAFEISKIRSLNNLI